MFKIITSVFIVTRRLEKHSILKFLRFKPLGHCNIFTFLLSFFFFQDLLSVCVGYLIDHVYVSLAFDFWHVFSEHLLFGIQCFKKHFVSISSVTFWHLYITHAYLRKPDPCPKLYVFWPYRNSNPTQSKYPIVCATNILETCYQRSIPTYAKITLSLLTLFSGKICFLMWTSTSLYNSRTVFCS